MQQKIEVIINGNSGTASGLNDVKSEIEAAFKAHNLEANVSVADNGEDLMKFAEEAAKSAAEIVVAGGGDGTISGVASKLIGTNKTLGVLPLGTLNHFSKDLQIPQDLAEAVRVIAENHTLEVDAAEVNGRVFINNSSIGLYPQIVRKREQHERLGKSKWSAAFFAATAVLRRYPFFNIKLQIDELEVKRKTPFLFIGNNEYEMDFLNIGTRQSLTDGKLSVYLLHRTGRAGLVMLAVRSMFGAMQRAKDFEAVKTDEITIDARRKNLLVAFDGEVELMETPLCYRIRPRALRVLVPEEKE